MKFLLDYWKLIAVVVALGVITAAYNLHVNKLIRVAVDKAVIERDAEWRKSEQDAIKRADDAARATEAAHAKDLETVRTKYQKELADAKTQRDRDVANARSGALVLRVPSNCAGARNDSKAAAAAGGSDGPATTELPREITADLFALADDADAIVKQLTACQAVILSDRKALQ